MREQNLILIVDKKKVRIHKFYSDKKNLMFLIKSWCTLRVVRAGCLKLPWVYGGSATFKTYLKSPLTSGLILSYSAVTNLPHWLAPVYSTLKNVIFFTLTSTWVEYEKWISEKEKIIIIDIFLNYESLW